MKRNERLREFCSKRGAFLAASFFFLTGSISAAQTSSIAGRQRAQEQAMGKVIAEEGDDVNPVVARESFIAAPEEKPKTYQVGDLVTIIVRQQTSFQSDSDLNSKNQLDLESSLDSFLKLTDGGLGASTFSRGHPDIQYKWNRQNRNKADVSSQNRLTTRLTAEVIDVKPNGNLVLMARAELRYGEECSTMTVTGTCAKDRLSVDGSVLSTDLAGLSINVVSKGAVQDSAKRGWLTRAFDAVKPF